MKEKVSVVGLGKAGLPLAAVIADSGHSVLGVDVSRKAVDMINAGKSPVKGEPGLVELIRKHRGRRLKATADPPEGSRATRVHIIIVPLLIDGEGVPDYKFIDAATRGVASGLKKGDLVVLETSVPVGTTRGRLAKILEEGSGLRAGRDFRLAYSPERIMTGYSVSRFREFPKVVGGIDEASTDDAYRFYRSFCKHVTKVSSAECAELVKLSEGVYRDVSIAIANELLRVSEAYGIDFWEMREAANHQYCNILEAGLGVGGHCIPVYPRFVIRGMGERGQDAPLARSARQVNDGMAAYYADKVVKAAPKGGKVAVVGLAFREGVDETFYTRSKPLIAKLKEAGFDVYGLDPMLPPERIGSEFGVKPHLKRGFDGFDCVVVANKNREYLPALRKAAKKMPVIDCRNIFGG